MNPKISVILPVYNTESYLLSSLESLCKQTFKDFEVLCIDDGSTDNSLDILEKFTSQDSRFKCISKKNEGLSATRNLGIKLAKGGILLFMDSDDQIEPTTLEICYKQMNQDNLDILLFDARSIYECEDLKQKFTWYQNAYIRSQEYNEIVSGEEIFNKMMAHGDYIVSACMYTISKKLLISNNLSFINGILYEDNVFTYKALMSATRVKHIKEQFYIRLVRQNSIVTKQVTPLNLDSYFRCYSEIYFYAKSKINCWKTQKNTAVLLASLQRHIQSHSDKLKRSKNSQLNPLDRMLMNFISPKVVSKKSLSFFELVLRTYQSLKSHGISATLTRARKFLSSRKK